MSGHSKWSTIKRKKGATDAKRANQFTRIARLITITAKEGKNLDLAIQQAKKANMPKDNIDRAIKRGRGEIEGVEIVSTNYEAYGPEGIGIIMEILTDNKNRALSEIKSILNRLGGNLASAGAVSYLFDREGVIELKQSGQTLSGEDLEMIIIDSGAKDYEIDEGIIYVYTNPKDLAKVKKALEFKSLKIDSAKLEMTPKNYIKLEENKKEAVIKLLTALEELDDVSEVYTNADL